VSTVLAGVSVWCAAGSVTVASPDDAASRLAAPASLWWLAGAAAAALLVPGWRRHPALAAPALLATLPWWPLPLSAPGLIWTGPMAWVPIGAALACGLTLGRTPRNRPAGGVTAVPSPRRSAVLAGVLTIVASALTAASIDTHTPGGDEPHYLVITQSLLGDGDLRIENNHRDRDYAAYYGGTLSPDFIQRGADGEIYSIHAPGVSGLVAPGFALAGYRGAQATVIVASAMAAALVWLAAWHATGRRRAAWFAWAAVTLTPTFLLHGVMIFPDAPGALAVAAAIWLMVRLATDRHSVSAAGLAAVGALLSAMPWLHTRFAIVAAALGLAIVLFLLADRESFGRRLVAFAAVPVVAAAAWFGFFWLVYGTPNPAAPYGTDSGARLAYIPGGLVALLFDQQFGLIAYAPVLAAGVLGVVAGPASPARRVARISMAVALAYAAAVTTYWMWWAGVPATPARFLTAVLPTAGLPLALTWAVVNDRGRQICLALLGISLGIAWLTVGVGDGALAWNSRNAEAEWLEWLGPVVNLPRAWPSFFWRLSPEDLATEIPFVVHVAAFGLVLAAGVVAAVALSDSGRAARRPVVFMLAWCLPGAIMASAGIGWWLNGVPGLDAARSQLSLVASVGRGMPVWQIGPWGARPAPDPLGELRVRAEEAGRTDTPPPAAVFVNVPAGAYLLRVAPALPTTGPLTVSIGRSATPLTTAPLATRSQDVPVTLPAGARVLTVTADPAQAGAGMIELRPERADPYVGPFAQSFTRYGEAGVHFLDTGAFVESAGFWVRGAAESEFVVVPGRAGGPVVLRLQNGATPNEITLTVDGREETHALGSSGERHVLVPATEPGAPVRIHVRSPAGFRPSDIGPSDDRRFLGVWIEIEIGSRFAVPRSRFPVPGSRVSVPGSRTVNREPRTANR